MCFKLVTVAILLCVCACNRTLVSAQADMPAEMKASFDKCLSDNGITVDDFKQNPDSEKSQCVLKCVAVEKNVLSKDGVLDAKALVEYIKKMFPGAPKPTDDQVACINKIVTITTCQDMKKIKDCMKP